ncbi:SDR family oxidoreductase [Microbacterium sp. zg-Y818]|nr:SDR family oxidoreductase [Microbacterium sp. zg-Y818]MCR2799337.1 SDR family oxidoreductase [Microbacterium sp. zg.Y818]WIM21337.1 SDR family oxidoreductase [Microbacterium sp. zg-Y818]
MTGASTGMGARFVSEVRREGVEVIALDVADPTVAVDDFIRVDLADPLAISDAADAIASLDALVNCAGVAAGGSAPDETVFAVNYLGLRALTDALVSKIRDGGAVLSIGSMAGHRWRDRSDAYRRLLAAGSFEAGLEWLRTAAEVRERPVYGVSKEAVWAYTSVLATTLFTRGIRVNSVGPGLVDTRLRAAFEGAMSDATRDRMNEIVGAPIAPAEITAVMRFVLSDAASRINAQNIVVDGGYLAGAEFAQWTL